MYKLTRAEVLALKPCSDAKVPDFGHKKYFTPEDAFKAGVTVQDFIWVLDKTGDKWTAVKMALIYAQYTADLNSDSSVQAAIDAGWDCVRDPGDKTSRNAANTALAANAAYYATNAAANAAYYATNAAANAAYYAANAAANAAYYSANAANVASAAFRSGREELRWIDVFNEAVLAK